MRHLERLPRRMSISIPPDEEGYIGRECPNQECLGYFKITLGTGIKVPAPCHCPYCGYVADQSEFTTRAQVEYVQSVAINQVTGALIKDLKELEFTYRPRGPFGIGISMKVEGRPEPVRHYREKQLETGVICDGCGLRYAIYGVFAFCPDCGVHNSLQILIKNLELVNKQLALASTAEPDLREHLLVDGLENAVSAFDAFGRETCRVYAAKSFTSDNVAGISFQNLARARRKVQEFFGIDMASCIEPTEWELAHKCFQKRHLFAHRMGVVDRAYLNATKDSQAVLGRKIRTSQEEVLELIEVLGELGKAFVGSLSRRGPMDSAE